MKEHKKKQAKSIYINREQSWLAFNLRVLHQADAPEVPLLERLTFCAIDASNLDEYFMVRAGSLMDRAELYQAQTDDKTGMTPAQQLELIYKTTKSHGRIRDAVYRRLMMELRDHRIQSLQWNDLTKSEKKKVHSFFVRAISPYLTVHLIDEDSRLPHLENLKTYALFELKNKRKIASAHAKQRFALVQFPDKAPAYYRLDDLPDAPSFRFYLSENSFLRFCPELFKNDTVKAKMLFRITRNADLAIDADFDEDIGNSPEYLAYMKNLLKKRSRLCPLRLDFSAEDETKRKVMLDFLSKRLALKKEMLFPTQTPLDLSFAWTLRKEASEVFPADVYHPILPNYQKSSASMFDRIAAKDILLHYPYHSIQTYIDFLREAVYDEAVTAIDITLYRLSRYSEIISLLKTAAIKGKAVTAVVEIKARFDEENNIHWAELLVQSGCRVLYGINHLKVHSKVTLVTRKEAAGIRCFAHIATGNYNEKTAEQYTDVGILTANQPLCEDLTTLFQAIVRGEVSEDYRCLLVSPTCLKSRLIAEIHREQQRAEAGERAYICLKLNSLTDKEMIETLVEASMAGVTIDLIVRGICCLKAGVRCKSENIRVISIVGRYLEHSRIYIFGEAETARVYIGSADLMTRNTTRRIEVLTPVYDPQIAATLIETTRIQLNDTVKAYDMLSDGNYKKREPAAKPLDSQIEMGRLYQ